MNTEDKERIVDAVRMYRDAVGSARQASVSLLSTCQTVSGNVPDVLLVHRLAEGYMARARHDDDLARMLMEFVTSQKFGVTLTR